jgi:6-phosphogluconolactonase
MPADTLPEQGACVYQETLKTLFQTKEGMSPVFDLLFLGMGHDGHIASLFPGHEALHENAKTVIPVKGGQPHVHRLTMTLPVINRARKIVFVISGNNKAGILKRVLEDKAPALPARYVQPLDGVLTWLVDQDAAAMLSKGTVHDAA